jgi:hypothetical protein
MTTIQLLSEREAEQSFEEMLDECHDTLKIGYLEFSPSEVLRRLDPVAYREEFILYCDNLAEDGIYVEDYTDDQMEEDEEEDEE